MKLTAFTSATGRHTHAQRRVGAAGAAGVSAAVFAAPAVFPHNFPAPARPPFHVPREKDLLASGNANVVGIALAIRDVRGLDGTPDTAARVSSFVRKLAYLLLPNLDEHELRSRLAESLDPADVARCFCERDMTLARSVEVLAALCRDRPAAAVLTGTRVVRSMRGSGGHAIAMAGACATVLARADDDVSVDGLVVPNDGDMAAALASRRVWLTVFRAMFRGETFDVDVGAVAAFARFMKRP